MEVSIDGHLETVPFCTCGKCIVRRLKKDFLSSLPYREKAGSTYEKDFDWKTNNKNEPEFYNRSKHSGFDGMFKRHLPTSLISTMKNDYRPFKVKLQEKPRDRVKLQSIPFYGRTSYETQFPNWGALKPETNRTAALPNIKIPLRGTSNYGENYIKYGPDYYEKKDPAVGAKGTLEFYGSLNPDTCYSSSYKPVELLKPYCFTNDRFKKKPIETCSFAPAKFPSDFTSSYANDYIQYQDQRCKLSEYLNSKGMKHLEI